MAEEAVEYKMEEKPVAIKKDTALPPYYTTAARLFESIAPLNITKHEGLLLSIEELEYLKHTYASEEINSASLTIAKEAEVAIEKALQNYLVSEKAQELAKINMIKARERLILIDALRKKAPMILQEKNIALHQNLSITQIVKTYGGHLNITSHGTGISGWFIPNKEVG